MKRIISAFLVLCTAFSLTLTAVANESVISVFSADDFLPYEETAEEVFNLENDIPSAILMERDSGEVLFEHNPDEKMPIASVTKIMTMLLVMEALDSGVIKLDDMVSVSDNAASMGGSQAYMEPGEQMSVNDMLKAVAVASCNDAAVALGEHISGSEASFVERMNNRARELGMTSTEFLNCTGLDDNEMHYSSARDVAIMSRELLCHEKIFDYTTIWMDSIRGGEFGLANTNKLIRFYNGANGLKTGYTSKARFCLSASADRDGMGLVAVVLGAPTSDRRFATARGLLDWGFANFSVYKVEPVDDIKIKVWGGKKGTVNCRSEGGVIVLPKGQAGQVKKDEALPKELNAPIKKGDKVGKITYTLGEEPLLEIDVTATETVEKAGVFDIFTSLLKGVFG